MSPPPLIRFAPALFVLLWSSGFIGARYGLPYAEPLTFLSLRFVLVISLLLPAALVARAAWPRTPRQALHIAVAGMLVHAAYLAGVFSAIRLGMTAGAIALIAGLQPLLTAVASGPLLGERVTPRRWGGLALGLAGASLVTIDGRAIGAGGAAATLFALVALAGITAGTLYQKKFCSEMDLRTGGVIQFGASLVVLAPIAAATETMRIAWTPQFAFALGWLVVVLSIGAISLLWLMVRHGEAARVASLFYLTPPTTAAIAYFAFDERIGALGLAGMALAAAGVALARRG